MVYADRIVLGIRWLFFSHPIKKEAVGLVGTGYFLRLEFNPGVTFLQMLRFAKFCN
ncbi:MAG: hypothetical protein RIE73_23360 [Coleofasciculus sp. C1-SOL-03]|uniref:hypothetical protein n=1 Tax=Coleofasciculus sp. C1-SOL-03 TaxID=3069522 RepID=UPI0032F160CF